MFQNCYTYGDGLFGLQYHFPNNILSVNKEEAMESVKEQFFSLLSSQYEMKKIDPAEFAKINIKGMNFVTEAYELKGFGHFAWMSMKGMAGLMKMDTVVLNPLEIDMPLFSYDRIKAMGKDTFITELYDTQIESFDSTPFAALKGSMSNVEDMKASERWYDAIKYKESIAKVGKGKELGGQFDVLTIKYLQKYLELAKEKPSCDVNLKREKAAAYSTGLVEQGGMAADNFVGAIGKEKTLEFFRTILFGA